jgi:hypothetical protein
MEAVAAESMTADKRDLVTVESKASLLATIGASIPRVTPGGAAAPGITAVPAPAAGFPGRPTVPTFVDIGPIRQDEKDKVKTAIAKQTKSFWTTVMTAVRQLSAATKLEKMEEQSVKYLIERVEIGLCFLGYEAKKGKDNNACYELLEDAAAEKDC